MQRADPNFMWLVAYYNITNIVVYCKQKTTTLFFKFYF